MEKIKNKINKLFQEYILRDTNHVFFRDIYNVIELNKDYDNRMGDFIEDKKFIKKENINFNEIKIRKKEYSILDFKDFKEFGKILKKSNKINDIKKYIDYNISNKYIKSIIQEKSGENIIIAGSGPNGLFLGCYLKYMYKNKYNITIFDNRIIKENLRNPYDRHRIFVTQSKYLANIFKNIYKYFNNNILTINIYILEYILLFFALFKYNINFIFKDYDWPAYKKLVKKYNCKYFFDCSSSRLSIDYPKLNKNWLLNIKKEDKNLNLKLSFEYDKNLVVLDNLQKMTHFRLNNYYGSILIYDKNNFFLYKYDFDINNIETLSFLNKINNTFYDFDNILKLIKNIPDNIIRNFLYYLIKDDNVSNNIFKINIWKIFIRHTIQPAIIFKEENHEFLYITIGDSMFHSHYIVGAGLNRTIYLTVKILEYL